MAITATIGAAVVGAGGSYLAGNAQASGAKRAAQTEMDMYNLTRSDLKPYIEAGLPATTQLQNLLGLGPMGASGMMSTLMQYPGYQWALDQGVQALDRSAASRGLLLSGGQLKDVQAYGQGLATQTFGQYYGQLSNLANLGENAAAGLGQAGSKAAEGAGQALQNAGTAQASGITGITNQIGGILNNKNIISDRRLKTDIVPVGETDSGLTVYSYRYKGDAEPRMGVMADEVRQVDPGAVHRLPSGFDAVDYDRVSRLPPLKKAA